jgi:hypothetical protein
MRLSFCCVLGLAAIVVGDGLSEDCLGSCLSAYRTFRFSTAPPRSTPKGIASCKNSLLIKSMYFCLKNNCENALPNVATFIEPCEKAKLQIPSFDNVTHTNTSVRYVAYREIKRGEKPKTVVLPNALFYRRAYHAYVCLR